MGSSEEAAVMATTALGRAVNAGPAAGMEAAEIAGDSLDSMKSAATSLGMSDEELDGAGFTALA